MSLHDWKVSLFHRGPLVFAPGVYRRLWGRSLWWCLRRWDWPGLWWQLRTGNCLYPPASPGVFRDIDWMIRTLPTTLPSYERVQRYRTAVCSLQPTKLELEYAWGRTGDHEEAPVSCCARDCPHRHAAYHSILYDDDTAVWRSHNPYQSAKGGEDARS